MAKDQRFEDYQRRQVSPNVIASFDAATHLVSFVVDHAGDTVFAGAWPVQGRSDETFLDPFVADPEDDPVGGLLEGETRQPGARAEPELMGARGGPLAPEAR